MIILDEKLKIVLRNAGLSKTLLSKEMGISSRTIAKIAKGEEISDRVVKRIAEFLQVPMDEILEKNEILSALERERALKLSGGLYHETQIRLAYNSNHIEGSRLTEDQTRYIFETKTLGALPSDIALDDVLEVNNHFKCLDFIIQHAAEPLSEPFITHLHRLLKEGTNFAAAYGAGTYKRFPNTVGGIETTAPADVSEAMRNLLDRYNRTKHATFEDIVAFHYEFECIHPFQDGNGRIGRLIVFKECLKNGVVPTYIDDRYKLEYYNGLRQWHSEKGYLLETFRLGQDLYKRLLDYFAIPYNS